MSKYTSSGDYSHWRDSARDALANLIGVPVKAHPRMRDLAYEFVPPLFTDIYVKSEDVGYVFYENRLAMGFAELQDTNWDAYLSDLGTRHQKIDTQRIQISDWTDPDGVRLRKWQDVVLFKKSGTNTRIYLTKVQGGPPLEYAFAYALYIPNHYFVRISRDIAANKARLETEASNARAQREREVIQRDLDKLR